MPTGYTYDVGNGKISTLREFGLTCARAFRALISMRDEPFSAPVPKKLKPDTGYHDNGLREAKEQLKALEAMGADEIAAAAKADADKIAAIYAASDAERLATENRYKAMLAQVVEWRVPAEIADLRKFMIEQLQQSIEFDCGDMSKYRDKPIPPAEWLDKRRAALAKDIEYHSTERAKVIARTAECNEWLAALHSSLPA